MAKQQPSDRSRAVTTQVGGTLVSEPVPLETDPAVKEGDLFDIQVTLNGDSQLRPQDFSSGTASPGFSVRFRQMLLNAGDGYLQLLQADNSLRGTLTVTIRVDQNPPEAWYQETDAWLLDAARAAIRNPERHRRAKGTPKGLVIDAVFQPGTTAKPLAPLPESCETLPILNNTGAWRVADFSRVLDQVIDHLPSDPREQLQAISELYAALQQRIAPKLAPALAEILRTTHELSYDEKAALAHEINAVLADVRLAIRDPKTKLPATLLAQRPKITGPTSYLRIWDTRKANDGKRHYFKVEDLGEGGAELELIDERDRSSDTQRD